MYTPKFDYKPEYCEVCNEELATVGDLATRLLVCHSCFETLNDYDKELDSEDERAERRRSYADDDAYN